MKENNKTIETKAYNYFTMMKTAYLWLPFFTIVLYICSYFEKLQIFLYLTVGAATYGFVLNQMKKKSIQIIFSSNGITIDKEIILFSDIEDYYICLPLNELFMLRLNTKKGKKILYIGKEFKKEVEIFLKNSSILENKTAYDTFLKYSHSTFLFVGILLCGIIMKLSYYIKYDLLK